MKLFVVSDVHGFYDEMIKALNENGFDINNPEHIFVSCGDLLDRGKQPLECLKFVNNLPQDRRYLICGNHEDLMEEAIERGYFMQHDEHNGTVDTALALTHHSRREIDSFEMALEEMIKHKLYNDYIDNLIDFVEIGNYIFVHGWIPCESLSLGFSRDKNYISIEDWENGNWETARWINGMNAWKQGVKIANKTIVCGHYHSSWGHCNLDHNCSEFGKDAIFTPYINEGIIALDGCTALSKFVNCIVIDI